MGYLILFELYKGCKCVYIYRFNTTFLFPRNWPCYKDQLENQSMESHRISPR